MKRRDFVILCGISTLLKSCEFLQPKRFFNLKKDNIAVGTIQTLTISNVLKNRIEGICYHIDVSAVAADEIFEKGIIMAQTQKKPFTLEIKEEGKISMVREFWLDLSRPIVMKSNDVSKMVYSFPFIAYI